MLSSDHSPPLYHLSSSISFPSTTIMFQRALLRQSQAARSAVRSFSTAPLAVRRPSPLHPQLSHFARPLIRQPAYRFYSSEKEGAENKKEEAKEGEAPAESEKSPEDALRAEVESKKKEAADLKVSISHLTLSDIVSDITNLTLSRIGQICPFGRGLPQPPGAHKA